MPTAIDNADIILVCNQALGLLGAEEITLNGTDRNHDLCTLFYEDSRDEILAAHKWNFAKTRTFAIETDSPLFGYDNAFTNPSDCLRVWGIDDDPLAKFEVEGGLILTNRGEVPTAWADATDYIAGQVVTNDDITYTCLLAHTSGALDDEPGAGALTDTYWTDHEDDLLCLPVEYVKQVTDIQSFPIYLKRCVILRLAIDLSAPIKGDDKVAANLQAMLYGSQKVRGYLDLAMSFDAQESGGFKVETNTWLNSRFSS